MRKFEIFLKSVIKSISGLSLSSRKENIKVIINVLMCQLKKITAETLP